MSAYYNEFEPYAAAWLRNLIKEGLIADGEVDERSIVDVRANDLRGFTQCHFFAGIGVWSYALRTAGWPDDRAVWTGSCPCQPFSAAGKGKGFEDERHLWPEFYRLIRQCAPPVVFGEQVASKDGLAWLDTVCTDMEASGYAIGATDLCAAGIGAPHIRQRLWFVGERLEHAEGDGREERRTEPSERGFVSGCSDGGLGDHHHTRLERQRSGYSTEGGWLGASGSVAEAGEPRGLANAEDLGCLRREVGYESGAEREDSGGREQEGLRLSGAAGAGGNQRLADTDEGQRRRLADGEGRKPNGPPTGWEQGDGKSQSGGTAGRPGPTNGHWRDADWLYCRDGKWRPVEPGTFPLAHGAPSRVGRLRAYGNAIVAQVAAEVIRAFMECKP